MTLVYLLGLNSDSITKRGLIRERIGCHFIVFQIELELGNTEILLGCVKGSATHPRPGAGLLDILHGQFQWLGRMDSPLERMIMFILFSMLEVSLHLIHV